jgi:hypothetical protein
VQQRKEAYMPKQHKSTEEKIAEINEILEPLNGEPLHIIPCLFFNEKTKHIFPYRIKFLLPQLCGYSESQQLVRIAYLNGYLKLRTETVPANTSLKTILSQHDFRLIKELLDPIKNNLLPQAETVLCPIIRENYGCTERRYATNLPFVVNRYVGYYQLLYATYEQGIRDIFKAPTNYVQFHELTSFESLDTLIKQVAPCDLAAALKRDVMLERLTYGYTGINAKVSTHLL